MFTTVIHIGQPARLGLVASPVSPAVPAAGQSSGQSSEVATGTGQCHGPNPLVGLRLCGSCRRPLVAEDRREYTLRRAALVAERGLCVCGVQVVASAGERNAALPG